MHYPGTDHWLVHANLIKAIVNEGVILIVRWRLHLQ